jgi:hypothetical protein
MNIKTFNDENKPLDPSNYPIPEKIRRQVMHNRILRQASNKLVEYNITKDGYLLDEEGEF